MSHYYAKFKENPCVGTDASTPFSKEYNLELGIFIFRNSHFTSVNKIKCIVAVPQFINLTIFKT